MTKKHLPEKECAEIKDLKLAKGLRSISTVGNLSQGDTIEIADLYLQKSLSDMMNSIEPLRTKIKKSPFTKKKQFRKALDTSHQTDKTNNKIIKERRKIAMSRLSEFYVEKESDDSDISFQIKFNTAEGLVLFSIIINEEGLHYYKKRKKVTALGFNSNPDISLSIDEIYNLFEGMNKLAKNNKVYEFEFVKSKKEVIIKKVKIF